MAIPFGLGLGLADLDGCQLQSPLQDLERMRRQANAMRNNLAAQYAQESQNAIRAQQPAKPKTPGPNPVLLLLGDDE